MKNRTLRNGVLMPEIGYGTFKISDESVYDNVLDALKAGYTHIDTATIYGNETGIGKALVASGVDRKSLFITTKIWNDDQGYERALEAVKESMQKLNTDYLDLVLIHWPNPLSAQTWKALEEMYTEGFIKAIGVSNFHKHHLEKLLESATIVPMVNQLERHPYLVQTDLKVFCDQYNILCQAWSPLAKGKVFEDETLKEIAQRNAMSVSQVVLTWGLQTGWVVLPKSSSKDRMSVNLDIGDKVLSEEDIALINSLNIDLHTGSNPDSFEF